MNKLIILLILGLFAAGCSDDATNPASQEVAKTLLPVRYDSLVVTEDHALYVAPGTTIAMYYSISSAFTMYSGDSLLFQTTGIDTVMNNGIPSMKEIKKSGSTDSFELEIGNSYYDFVVPNKFHFADLSIKEDTLTVFYRNRLIVF